MRRLLVVIAMMMLIPGVAHAGGGGVDTSGCAGYGEGATVVMKDSCFAGTAHFAASGTTITVDNGGELPHTLTAVDGSFDTGSVEPGSAAEIVVDEPGIYRVFCSLHGTAQGEGMAGVLIVGEAAPPAVAAPTDTSAISEAVASETGAVLNALQEQESTIRGIDATQAELLGAVERLGEREPPAPEVIEVEGEIDPVQLVVLLVVGLGVGLALAALLAVFRLRLADRSSPATLEGYERSAEA